MDIQRSKALYNGEIIGIESIYTVINGEQINIPDKVEKLRELGRKGELICPCGKCNGKLILVAGDRNLRRQHFRLKDAKNTFGCTYIEEGADSINAKILLKCWIDEKLNVDDLEARVQVSDVSDSNRRFEYTFMSKHKHIAVCYTYKRENLYDEKMDCLIENSKDIHVLFFTDISNEGTDMQYPEWLMKIQKRQGYCLLLSSQDTNYDQASLKIVYYGKTYEGYWKEINIFECKLRNLRIEEDGSLFYFSNSVDDLVEKKITEFNEENQRKQARHEELLKEHEEFRQKQEERRKLKEAEEIKKRKEYEELEAQKLKQQWEEFYNKVKIYAGKSDAWLTDPDGDRVFKCLQCGQIKKEGEFTTHTANTGVCKECYDKDDYTPVESTREKPTLAKPYNPTICPECGGKLKTKSGKYGMFYGCSNYPKCKYTRRI